MPFLLLGAQVLGSWHCATATISIQAIQNHCRLTIAFTGIIRHYLAEYVNEHLKKYGLIAEEGVRQTDNGVEYCGSWSAKEPSAYTLAIEEASLTHGTIPPGAHRFQSDVETVHNLIEAEFYEIESFADRTEFMEKANTYQLFFNLERPNTYKENKSPWQLAQEKRPSIPKEEIGRAHV